MANSRDAVDQLPPIDKLMARPDEGPLPTKLDPAGPESHGYPADPKLVRTNKTDPQEPADPAPAAIGRSA